MSDGNLQAPLFRGATKPPMLFGAPMMAVISVFIPSTILSIVLSSALGLLAYTIILIPLITVPIMRDMTQKDDQYLRMFGLNIREKLWSAQNKDYNLNITVIPPNKLRLKD